MSPKQIAIKRIATFLSDRISNEKVLRALVDRVAAIETDFKQPS